METQQKRDWLEVYGEEYRQRGLYMVAASYDPGTSTVHVRLRAGMTISFAKERAQALAGFTGEQLADIEVSPAGWSVDPANRRWYFTGRPARRTIRQRPKGKGVGC